MPRDETSLLRIINTPPRGIGAKTIETLMQQAVQQGCCVWDIACRSTLPDGLPEKARTAVRQLVELVKRFQHRAAARSGTLADLLRDLIETTGYQAELQRQYDDPNEQQTRWDSVQDVVNALADYEAKSHEAKSHEAKSPKSQAPTLGEFLDSVALAGREFDNDKEDQLRRNSVALMTLHCAKGLEFPYVYMVGMEDGVLPHRRSVDEDGSAIDEERRLCYVGMTRAQERLTFSLALTRRKWGKPRDTMPSRFLYELTGQAQRSPHLHPHRPRGRKPTGAPPTSPNKRSPRNPSAGTN
jgi:DNA helicase-2/ATP-dependent DNA helicase PcrA